MNNNQLLLDNYIETEEFGIIYFPTVEFLKKYGDEEYNKLVFPFALTVDILDIDKEYKKEIKVFDLFFQSFMLDENNSYFNALISSLKYYFKLDPIYDKKNYCIFIGSSIIHRNNFDQLADIILTISKSKRLKIEKPVFENEIQKDVYYKIQEGRKKRDEKNSISFATIINIVMNCGNTYISPQDVSAMTIYQLMSRYETILGIDTWEINFRKYLVGSEIKDLDLTYWVNKINIK